MKTRVRTAVIMCPAKKREVEIQYSVSGGLLSRKYSVLECPAMGDGGHECDHRCERLIEQSPGFRTLVPTAW